MSRLCISTRRAGFSLVELIVVIGIIMVLLALMLPVLAGARRAAYATQCASNIRQLGLAMISYSAEFNNSFPPNVGLEKIFWYNNDAIGRHVYAHGAGRSAISEGVEQQIGGVFLCPADLEETVRSYSMNTFASSVVSPAVSRLLEIDSPRGRLFKANVGEASNMILLIESFPVEEWPAEDPNPTGWASPALVGFSPVEIGRRFGGGGAVYQNDVPRFGSIAAQIAYYRHRRPKQDAGLGHAIGRLNIVFADGHVALHAHDELFDRATGKSTYLAMWSPIDREVEQQRP